MYKKEIKAMKAYLEIIQCVDPEKIKVIEDDYCISCQVVKVDTSDFVCLYKTTGKVLITSYQATHVRDLLNCFPQDDEAEF